MKHEASFQRDVGQSISQPAQGCSLRQVIAIIGIALAYFVAHQIAFFFPDAKNVIMLVWPAGGVGLTAFLLNPRRLWPMIAAVCYIAGISADIGLAGRSFWISLGFMTGNMVESIGCAWLIQRAGKDFKYFGRVREIQSLIIGVVSVNAVSSCIGAGTSVLARGASFSESWTSWFISDGLGILVIAPFFTSWIGARKNFSRISPGKTIEAVFCFGAWTLVNLIIFKTIDLKETLVFPPSILVGLLMWPAIRFGPPGVTLALILYFAIAAVSPGVKYGPSPLDLKESDVTHRLLELQVFLGFLAAVGLLLAASFADRKRAQDDLRLSEERFRAVATNTPDHILMQDRDLRYTLVLNPQLGFTQEMMLGKTDDECLDPVDARKLTGIKRNVLETNLPVNVSTSIMNSRGELEFFEGAYVPRHDDNGKVAGLIGYFRNVTERKIAEKTIAAAREDFDRFWDCLTDLACIASMDGRFKRVNPAWEQTLGYAIAELTDAPLISFVHPDDTGPTLLALQRLSDGQKNNSFVNRYRRKDGSYRWLEWQSTPSENGQLIYAVARDITARKQAEEEREKLQSQLAQAQKMESVGRLAGGVAHDFNNMLTVILGHVKQALDAIGPSAPIHDDLLQIQKSAERSADLTRQLLSFARKQPIVPRVIDLNETIKDLLLMLNRLIGETIQLTFTPCDGPAFTKIDLSQINQILANLCVNARDAIAEHGAISIVTRQILIDKTPAQNPMNPQPGDYILLSVRDNGCGMDQQTISRLFEPFFTTKEIGKGAGLGLATVYGIVRQNDGFISVDSEPSKGAVFKIYLRRHIGLNEPNPKNDPGASLSQGNETILLVEDEPAILNIFTKEIARQGYAVLAADSPAQALRVARENPQTIHLLVTDVVMPEMNGHELAKQLLAIHPDLKCLYMSGYTSDIIDCGLSPGQNINFIEKPLTIANLTAKIRQLLDQV